MVAALPRMEVFVPRQRVRDKTDPGPLARILKRLRGEFGIGQKEVVRRAGWDVESQQGYYSSLETGAIRNPGDDKLKALDKAFELEPGSLKYWLRHGPPWAMLQEAAPSYDLLHDDEVSVLLQRVPPHRREEAVEIIRRQTVEVLKIMGRDEAS